jgi:TolB-like protein
MLKMIVMLLLALSVAAGGPASAVQFAVVPGTVSGADAAAGWLGNGVAFDLEKRLERWSCLRDVDRLSLRQAVKGVLPSDVARAVFERLKPEVVVTFSGDCSAGRIRLTVRLWTEPSSSQALAVDGALDELFALDDRITDAVVAQLRKSFPSLPVPNQAARLHLAPAGSVTTFGFLARGMVALQEGDAKAARPLLAEALKREPKLWWAHYFLGAVAFHEGRFDQAARHCRDALAIDPNLYPGVYANLSYCYSGLGDGAQARWAKSEFERRAGTALPARGLPGTPPPPDSSDGHNARAEEH